MKTMFKTIRSKYWKDKIIFDSDKKFIKAVNV